MGHLPIFCAEAEARATSLKLAAHLHPTNFGIFDDIEF